MDPEVSMYLLSKMNTFNRHLSLLEGNSLNFSGSHIVPRWRQLKDLLFSPRILGEDFQFDYFFSNGLKPPTRKPGPFVGVIFKCGWQKFTNSTYTWLSGRHQPDIESAEKFGDGVISNFFGVITMGLQHKTLWFLKYFFQTCCTPICVMFWSGVLILHD